MQPQWHVCIVVYIVYIVCIFGLLFNLSSIFERGYKAPVLVLLIRTNLVKLKLSFSVERNETALHPTTPYFKKSLPMHI